MLTSGNQYLRPEYLTPLPTTLDAKKSPLALLAQTCSQIGADLPNSKLIQCSEKNSKNSKSESSKSKSPSTISSTDLTVKSSFKPYETNLHREKTQSPEERSSSNRVRTPISKTSAVSNSRCSSNQSDGSPGLSPVTSERKTPATEGNDNQLDRTTPIKSNERIGSPQTPSSSNGKTSSTPSILTSTTDPSIKDLPLGTFKPGAGIHQTSTFLGAYPTAGIPLPMDLMASSILSHHQALKSGAFGPYASYGRMKSTLGADSLAPACRDPYCTGCSLSSHLLASSSVGGKPSCPAGCTQCDHAASKSASYLGHNPVAAAYAHAQLAALAAATQLPQLPYVCNWIAGDASYCGKRFSSSDELLQHLRSHTAIATTADTNSTLAMLNSTSLPPTHPLLHRTYPTPPLSPLATARYHPYSKPSLLPPSLTSSTLSSFPLGHPGLPPYLSPYSLYGPRLGTASGMHP
ncbi:hypothetical protein ILUMI_21444 [Ignelater luminosus]|uniref:C2H2-type domain-containing protein n=1 Tax=Ignelater luminosus TaxID=2038154 RepID=A0A8K0CHQ4_IGNLU|nr:hypothetical protein ILUMI_21444 [Ignelater luminosus]